MSFWTESELEPVRKYRFQIQSPDTSLFLGNWWWAKSIDKPSYEVNTQEYQLTNHKFKFPGIVSWNDINMTIVDFVGHSQNLTGTSSRAQLLMDNLGITYDIPTAQLNMGAEDQFAKSPLTFINMVLSQLVIQQVDAKGSVIEKWTLYDVFIKSVDFGSLAYSDDELIEITIGLSYDYATLETHATK